MLSVLVCRRDEVCPVGRWRLLGGGERIKVKDEMWKTERREGKTKEIAREDV